MADMTLTARPLSDGARAALARAVVDDTRLVLPDQLDRAVYVEVNKALERLGGRWNRKAKAHVFPQDPADDLATVVDTGLMPADADKLMSFWPTPRDVAAEMCEWANVGALAPGSQVLEPSAGDGALAEVIRDVAPRVGVLCVEPDPTRAEALRGKGFGNVHQCRFEEFAAAHDGAQSAAVLMNPPFTLPGRPVAWAEHVLLAFPMVAPGGRLVAVVPRSVESRRHTVIDRVRDLADRHGSLESLPDDAFTPSGTAVLTTLVVLEAPA
mgnify:CR=1 FL=1